MTRARGADVFLAKATRALESARLLLVAHDYDGACSRAYYAMFDAARAALLVQQAGSDVVNAKTHRGLIAMFSQKLVLTGLVDTAFGRSLSQAQELRVVADYLEDQIDLEKATWAVTEAVTFVAEMQLIMNH